MISARIGLSLSGLVLISVAAAHAVGCSSSEDTLSPGASQSPDGGSASSTGEPNNTGFPDGGDMVVGAVDGGVKTTLPLLPPLEHVFAKLEDDSAEVTFDPVEGALDYRVYPLPNDADITASEGGQVVIKNAVYRCAGDREAVSPIVEDAPYIASDAVHTQIAQSVGGYQRTKEEAVLGYVFTDPGPDLVPVYALGDSDPNADVDCYFARWSASRSKTTRPRTASVRHC